MMWWTTPAPGIECAKRVSLNNESPEGVVHMQVSTIGVDLAKNVFQVHGVDSAGKVVITRQLRRKQVIEFLRNSRIGLCRNGLQYEAQRLGPPPKVREDAVAMLLLIVVGARIPVAHAVP